LPDKRRLRITLGYSNDSVLRSFHRFNDLAEGGLFALIAMNTGQRAISMFDFEKKDPANSKPDELRGYRKGAKIYLG
jgi:hypothetical protein